MEYLHVSHGQALPAEYVVLLSVSVTLPGFRWLCCIMTGPNKHNAVQSSMINKSWGTCNIVQQGVAGMAVFR